MNGLLERNVTHSDTVPEMLIDFETLTWTCSEHDITLRLDSGEDCPRCRVERPLPDGST